MLLIVLYDCKIIKNPVTGTRAQMPRKNLIVKNNLRKKSLGSENKFI